MVELSFNSGNQVEGRWLVNASQNSNGQVYYEQAISFVGTMTQDSYGRYIIQAGPLGFITSNSSNMNYFQTYFFNGSQNIMFGNVTIY